MNIKLFGLVLLIMPTASIADNFPKLDEAYTAGSGTKDLRPVFDMDMDGCLPSAGISRDGRKNRGLNNSGAIDGDCRHDDFLDYANTLHRYACITYNGGIEYCTHFYALYFKKDQASLGFGHRHDWEYVSIWTKDGNETHGGYSAHGDHFLRKWQDVPKMDDGRAKFVYHKDGVQTHTFRFAKDDEFVAENPTGKWITPDITSWYEIYGDDVPNKVMRGSMNNFDYGTASIPMKDSNFLNNINKIRPSEYPNFTEDSVDASNPNSENEWDNSIVHRDTSLCLDIQGGLESGNKLIAYDCKPSDDKESDNQRFFYDGNDKSIKIKGSDLCLDVPYSENTNNKNVQAHTCNSGTNQKWTIDGDWIVTDLSGTRRCMSKPYYNINEITLWPCDSNDQKQMFKHELNTAGVK